LTIAIPQSNPEAAPLAIAIKLHRSRSASSPFGNLVTMTAAKEMTPGTVKSRPPCCTTSVWPIDAMARTAAKDKVVANELPEMFPGASSRASANRSPVATQMARNFGGRMF
jgi:hypothetical protein